MLFFMTSLFSSFRYLSVYLEGRIFASGIKMVSVVSEFKYLSTVYVSPNFPFCMKYPALNSSPLINSSIIACLVIDKEIAL